MTKKQELAFFLRTLTTALGTLSMGLVLLCTQAAAQDLSGQNPKNAAPVASRITASGRIRPTLVYENQTIRQDLRLYLRDDILLVKGCDFLGAALKVRGKGHVILVNSVFDSPPTLGVMIMVDGQVYIDNVSIFGTGTTPDGNRYSGLTIHGATQGGRISNVTVADFPGNGILLEASIPIAGLNLNHVEIYDCAGGLWLFNTSGCTVSDLVAFGSNYNSHPKHQQGNVYPCVLDERLAGNRRVRSDTVFRDVVCQPE